MSRYEWQWYLSRAEKSNRSGLSGVSANTELDVAELAGGIKNMHRSIIHIDQNAFFASVEQQANPELQGKPIAVVGASHRTVITTASYEARAFGVKTGMAIWEGKRVCPELIIVRGDNKKYTHTSSEIVKMMLEYTPLVEPFSIDGSPQNSE